MDNGPAGKPSIDVNDTAMLSGKISLPVVYFRNVPSACESNDRISFFRKSRHCLSASLLGLHSIDLTTFLADGVFDVKNSAMRSGFLKGSYLLSSHKIGAQH